jgi:hypothetical protein
MLAAALRGVHDVGSRGAALADAEEDNDVLIRVLRRRSVPARSRFPPGHRTISAATARMRERIAEWHSPCETRPGTRPDLRPDPREF